MIGCKKCTYFKKASWSMLPLKIFGTFGLSHRINRVCGFCMDGKNQYFNSFAKRDGRGIGKIQLTNYAEMKGYDTENISKLIYDWLDKRFNVNMNFLEDYEIDEQEFIDEIEYQLSEIF